MESQDAAQWGNLGSSREPESLSVPVRDPEVIVVTDQPSAPRTPSFFKTNEYIETNGLICTTRNHILSIGSNLIYNIGR
jgi:hypothetical protein